MPDGRSWFVKQQASVGFGSRLIGWSVSAGAVLAFGMTPLASAPTAHADGLDAIIDPIINSLASLDPVLGADWTSWVANLDSALDAALTVDPSSAAATTTDFAEMYAQSVYEPIHTFDQQWIEGTSFFGPGTVTFDDNINSLFGVLLIGNGTDGIEGAPDGTAGGLWFGDGGDGWNSTLTGIDGGDGGAAYMGDGGIGGMGGLGADGGDGGATAMGIGGDGGMGGLGRFTNSVAGFGGNGGDGGDITGYLFGIGGPSWHRRHRRHRSLRQHLQPRNRR